MDQRGKNTPLIVVTILVCLVGLGVLNYVQTKANPTEAEKAAQQQEQAAAAQAAAKSAAAKAASTPAPTPSASTGAAFNGTLPSELVIGDPAKAKIRLTVGYTYDDATAQNAGPAHDVIQTVQDWAKAHPGDSVQIVCLDIPQDQLQTPADASVPLGISINQSQPPPLAVNPGEGTCTADQVKSIISGLP